MVEEINAVCKQLAAAFDNRSWSQMKPLHFVKITLLLVMIPWDVDRYNDRLTRAMNGRDKAAEDVIKNAFPPLSMPRVEDPAIVVEKHGRILAWILPDILSKERQVSSFNSYERCFDII